MNNKSKYKKKNICLIGVGKVGSAFYQSFRKYGYNLKYAVDKNIRRLRIITSDDYGLIINDNIKKEYLEQSDVIIFALTEKNLQCAINKCSTFKLDLKDKIIFHTSGFASSDVFKPLNARTINIGSFHPLQTFNTISYNCNKILSNIYFGIEGGIIAINYFTNVCKSLKSKYVVIEKNKKVLYHSICVIASNFLVSHMNIIKKLSRELMVKEDDYIEMFKPIIKKTLNNIFDYGVKEAITGPFARGEVKTIDFHLKYFKNNLPSFLYYYIMLGIEAKNISQDKKSITNKTVKDIEKLFLNHIK